MKEIKIDDIKLICYEDEKFFVFFSTGENSVSFNSSFEEDDINFLKLKKRFSLKEIALTKQIHSDVIIKWKEGFINNEIESDGIYIKENKSVAAAVYTADCVPVIITCSKENIIIAIHSGWKGTLDGISGKAIEKIKNEYSLKGSDFKCYIGPHNKSCCYEVSEELIEKFCSDEKFINHKEEIHKERYLNMEKCIEIDLRNQGLKEIFKTNECTYCSNRYKFNSFRLGCEGKRQISGVYIL